MYICTHFIGVLEGYHILDPRSVHLLPADMGGATLWELQQLIKGSRSHETNHFPV